MTARDPILTHLKSSSLDKIWMGLVFNNIRGNWRGGWMIKPKTQTYKHMKEKGKQGWYENIWIQIVGTYEPNCQSAI